MKWKNGYYIHIAIMLIVAVASVALLVQKPSSTKAAGSYSTSWIGNDLPGGDNDGKHVAHNVEGMFVRPDGTVYTNVEWEEGQMNLTILNNGQVQNRGFNTDTGNGGPDVVANDAYVYQLYISGDGAGFRRLDTNGNPASFNGGAQDGSQFIVNSDSNQRLAGLALNGNTLYASDPANNRIVIINVSNMTSSGSFDFSSPGKLAYDGNGGLWIVQSSSNTVRHYSTGGNDLGQSINDLQQPGPVAIDNQGRLLVGEQGPDQWIRIYDVSGAPSFVDTFGVQGGVFGQTAGEVQPLKFNKVVGLGTDDSGNIYVANGGSNTLVQSYTSSGSLRWTASGLHFEDNAAADPTSENDVYSVDKHYVMDYSKPAGQEWTLKGYTLNPFKYPEDARLNAGNLGGVHVQEVRGHRFLIVTDQYGVYYRIYRFDQQTDGEVAIPSALFAHNLNGGSSYPPNNPGAGCYFWRDANGNGAYDGGEYMGCPQIDHSWSFWLDSNGDAWYSNNNDTIYHYPFQGFDSHGNIIYTSDSLETFNFPSPFTTIKRLEYYPNSDTLYISGYTAGQSSDGEDLSGKTIARYNNWSQGNRNAAWVINPPYAFNGSETLLATSIAIAGDYLFVGYYVAGGNPPVNVFRLDDGSQVTSLTPTNNVLTCDLDIPWGISAYQRSDGQYLVFHSDHCFGKVVMFRWDA